MANKIGYRFSFGEAVGTALILLGLPGAAFGTMRMFEDGLAILGLTPLHWVMWWVGVAVAGSLALLNRDWRPLMGVPLILMLVFTVGMGDPNSAVASGVAESPAERLYLGVQQIAKWGGLVAPAVFGLLLGAAPLLSRISSQKR